MPPNGDALPVMLRGSRWLEVVDTDGRVLSAVDLGLWAAAVTDQTRRPGLAQQAANGMTEGVEKRAIIAGRRF